MRRTGLSFNLALTHLVLIGESLFHGNAEQAGNRAKFLNLTAKLWDAQQRAEEKLKLPRAHVRAAAQALKIPGPDIADTSNVGSKEFK